MDENLDANRDRHENSHANENTNRLSHGARDGISDRNRHSDIGSKRDGDTKFDVNADPVRSPFFKSTPPPPTSTNTRTSTSPPTATPSPTALEMQATRGSTGIFLALLLGTIVMALLVPRRRKQG